MEENVALLKRQTLALFNFWSATKNKNKRIGDLTIGDFFEISELILKFQKSELSTKGEIENVLVQL
jgi:hypothetical protein